MIDFEKPSHRLKKPVSFLVVDDEQRAREGLIRLLQRNWSDITEAEDGDQAIALIQKRKFNLIILDLNMPGKTGDQVLIEVAERLKAETRTGDTLARLGGDEFMLLLPQPTSREQAQRVAQKLITSMQRPFFLKNKEVYVNVSVGIAVFPDDSDDINTLVKNADMAMYEVKSSGKNGYIFYNDKLEHV